MPTALACLRRHTNSRNLHVYKLGDIATTKKCPQCGGTFLRNTDNFTVDKKRHDRVGSWCRNCKSERRAAHYELTRKKPKKYGPAYWSKDAWVGISADTIRTINRRARWICKNRGRPELTDEVASRAIINTAQGRRVKMAFVFSHVCVEEFGAPGSVRQQATQNMVSFSDPGEWEQQERGL